MGRDAWLRLLLAGTLGGSAGACTNETFQCTNASDCVLDALQGHCEANGHCSFDDSDCDSGRRYGEIAPGSLAGECVPVDDLASSGMAESGSATTTTTTASTESGTATSASTTSTGTTSTTGPVSASGPTTDPTTETTGLTSTASEATTFGDAVTEVWGAVPDADHPDTVRDTWINLNDDTAEADPRLRLYTWPSFRAANVVIFQWDLSAIAGAQIDSATLTLQVTGLDEPVVQEEYRVTVHRLLGVEPNLAQANGNEFASGQPWTENPCCAMGVPMAQGDITGPEASAVVPSTPGPVDWDVTDVVQAMVNAPDDDRGFVLNPDVGAGADADRIFASSEDEDASMRPRLEITYRLP